MRPTSPRSGTSRQVETPHLAAPTRNQVLPWDLGDLEALCSNAVYRPPLLTPRLLAAVADLKSKQIAAAPRNQVAKRLAKPWTQAEDFTARREKWFHEERCPADSNRYLD